MATNIRYTNSDKNICNEDLINKLRNMTTPSRSLMTQQQFAIVKMNYDSETQMLIICTSYKSIILWDYPNSKIISTLVGHQGVVKDAILIKDKNQDRKLVSIGEDGAIIFWSLETFTQEKVIQAHGSDGIQLHLINHSVLLSFGGAREKFIKLWNFNRIRALEIKKLKYQGTCFSLIFLQQNQIAFSDSHNIELLLINTSFKKLKALKGHSGIITTLEKSIYDPSIIFSAAFDFKIKIWNIHQGLCLKTLSHPDTHFQNVKLVNERVLLATQNQDGIVFWDIHQGQPITTVTTEKRWTFIYTVVRINNSFLYNGSKQNEGDLRAIDIIDI